MFVRFLLGFLVQIIPCAYLCFGSVESTPLYKRKKEWFCFSAYFTVLAVLFALCSALIAGYVSDSPAGFTMINSLFFGMLLAFLFYYIKFVKKSVWLKLFVFLYFTNSAFIVTEIANLFLSAYYRNVERDMYPYYGICIPVLAVVSLIFLPIFSKLLRRGLSPVIDRMEDRVWKLLCVFGAGLFFLMYLAATVLTDESRMRPDVIVLLAALAFTGISSYYFIFRLINLYIQNSEIQARERLLGQEIMRQKERYLCMQSTTDMIFQTRHDVCYQFVRLRQMIQREEYDKINGYMDDFLEQYLRQTAAMVITPVSENYIVDTFIHYYQELAGQKKIAFTWKLDFKKESMPADPDLTVILGNLLEDAFHACEAMTSGEKYVSLIICSKEEKLIITVDNSRGEEQEAIEGQSQSGLEAACIGSIAEKYHGDWLFETEKNECKAGVWLAV